MAPYWHKQTNIFNYSDILASKFKFFIHHYSTHPTYTNHMELHKVLKQICFFAKLLFRKSMTLSIPL